MYISIQEYFCDLVTIRTKKIDNRRKRVGRIGDYKDYALVWVVRSALTGHNFTQLTVLMSLKYL